MAITMVSGAADVVGTSRGRAAGDQGWYGLCLEPQAPSRPVRLPASTYRRRRAVAAGLVVVLVLALAVALGTLGGGPLPASERPGPAAAHLGEEPVYVVQQGDTFWSIARRLRPNGDPRPLVDRLVAAHGSATLHVGERIPLPGR